LRGIHNAWQFWFESALVFTAQWFRLSGGVVHPLMRRYVYLYFSGLKLLRSMFFTPLAVRPSCLSKSTLSAQVREFLNP
ncbi:hypothetical protein, partial [Vibrio parahaemolyticus]|uniref:hypothetical protein n=1 Tax=Vibrio parahaemolyticus TaxID=670 RepID=UPI0033653437